MTNESHPIPGHGSRARYLHRTERCRCPACTAANAAYIRHWRSGRAATPATRVHPAQLEMWT
jgi:hypothetical protein